MLLPGDPDRATLVADSFLDNARRYTSYRHLYGYTGTYQGLPVSVQTTGMGCPSLAIVVEELVNLGARTLIRIGTSGAASEDVRPGDLIVATASVANEGTSRHYLRGEAYSAAADFGVTRALVNASNAAGAKTHVGLIQTDDGFYAVKEGEVAEMARRGVLAVEMEASALFLLGALRRVRTGCILVASNNIGDPQFVEASVLDNAVRTMILATLNAAVNLEGRELGDEGQ